MILGSLLAFALVFIPAIFSVYAAGPGPFTIYNPLDKTGIKDVPGLIAAIVKQIITVGYFIIVFFVLYSGFLFVKARGDEKGITDAKNAFLWTVVGAAVLLGAQLLSTIIQNTVKQLGG